MTSEKTKRAVLNPRGVGNLRAVEKEIRRLKRWPESGEDAELAISRLERFREWYVMSLARMKGKSDD